MVVEEAKCVNNCEFFPIVTESEVLFRVVHIMFDGFKIILCWYRILRLMFQAVPYSRDYKRKYEYMKSQLRKPVSVCSIFRIHTYVS